MARKRKRDALQPSVDLPLRDNNTKDVADMRVTRAKSRRLQPKTAITDLPVDVLISIFSRLPNENVLLGAVAKVNREFRDIATDKQVRGAVQERFVRDLLTALSEGFLDCMMFSLITAFLKVNSLTVDIIVSKGHVRIFRYLVEEWNIGDITAVSLEQCAFFSVNGGRDYRYELIGYVVEDTYDIIRYVVEDIGLGSDWDARVKLLRNAISGGYLGAVRYFVQEGRDGRKLMYACADNGATALHTAAETGKLEIVRYLVEDQGAEDMVFMKDRDGNTPLMSAVSKGKRGIMVYFLEKFRTSNLLGMTSGWKNDTVLHICLHSYEPSLFRSLAEAGPANLLTRKNDCGQTVLHVAAYNGDLDIVRYILGERGATDLVTDKDASADTPLMLAVHEDKVDVVRYLIEEGGASSLTHDVDSSGNTLLHTCARMSSTATIEYLWEHGGMAELLRVRNCYGQTALHVASSRDSLETVRFLVEKCGAGEMVHDVDDDGNTVIHLAAQDDALECIRYFVEDRGAEDLVEKVNYAGKTVLQYSSGDTLRYFLEEREMTNLLTLSDADGVTVLHSAASFPHPESVQCLFEHPETTKLIHARDNNGRTCLFNAVESLDTIRWLLENTACRELVSVRDDDENTVLHVVAAVGNVPVAQYLVEEGGAASLLRATNGAGETVLHMAVAAEENVLNIIRYFVEKAGAADLIHKVDNKGNTVLHSAVSSQRSLAQVRYFIEERGARDLISRANDDGETVLQIARRNNILSVVHFLDGI
eukprot:Rmarinus@m.18746